MNKFFGIGRLVRDPELRYSQQGKGVCKFTLAITRTFNRDEADFLNVVCFGKTAENVANYCFKGSQVAVDGSVQVRTYEKDGEKRYITEIIAQNVQFLGGGNNSNPSQKADRGQNKRSDDVFGDIEPSDFDSSNLPF